jgi:hypothetical protein
MVVPAADRPGLAVVNGMSFSAQRGFFANSAVITEVREQDYGVGGALAGLDWQERIERQAAQMAGGGGAAIVGQRVSDFLAARPSEELPKTSYPFRVVASDLRLLLPAPVVAGMVAGILSFDAKLKGFGGAEGVLLAPETRTTSPVRFHRSPAGESTTVPGLFPLGEGAGYGGGIISCALDGVRAARAIASA